MRKLSAIWAPANLIFEGQSAALNLRSTGRSIIVSRAGVLALSGMRPLIYHLSPRRSAGGNLLFEAAKSTEHRTWLFSGVVTSGVSESGWIHGVRPYNGASRTMIPVFAARNFNSSARNHGAKDALWRCHHAGVATWGPITGESGELGLSPARYPQAPSWAANC